MNNFWTEDLWIENLMCHEESEDKSFKVNRSIIYRYFSSWIGFNKKAQWLFLYNYLAVFPILSHLPHCAMYGTFINLRDSVRESSASGKAPSNKEDDPYAPRESFYCSKVVFLHPTSMLTPPRRVDGGGPFELYQWVGWAPYGRRF